MSECHPGTETNMSRPNNLPQSKGLYLTELLDTTELVSAEVLHAAIALYHCEVPLKDAKVYIKTLEAKCQSPQRYH